MFVVSSAVTLTSPDLKSNLQNFDPFILTFLFYPKLKGYIFFYTFVSLLTFTIQRRVMEDIA